jgi:hypothetical protein
MKEIFDEVIFDEASASHKKSNFRLIEHAMTGQNSDRGSLDRISLDRIT